VGIKREKDKKLSIGITQKKRNTVPVPLVLEESNDLTKDFKLRSESSPKKLPKVLSCSSLIYHNLL